MLLIQSELGLLPHLKLSGQVKQTSPAPSLSESSLIIKLWTPTVLQYYK